MFFKYKYTSDSNFHQEDIHPAIIPNKIGSFREHLARRGQATLVEGARGTARDGTKGGWLRSPLWIPMVISNPQKLGYAITLVTNM